MTPRCEIAVPLVTSCTDVRPVAGAAGSVATVRSQIRNGGTLRSAQDAIRLAGTCGAAGGEPPLFSNGME